jgi:hypothetical protein
MSNITAILSMLHEPVDRHSASRVFRGQSVISWTLRRLSRAKQINSYAILCWDDQLLDLNRCALDSRFSVISKGPRQAIPNLDGIAAACRWTDGWRAGLQQSCCFDRGFHASWFRDIATDLQSDLLLMIDPSSALVDPHLLESLFKQAESHPDIELYFSQAAPGLSGALLRTSLLNRLVPASLHPGKLLHYLPDNPEHDPTSSLSCVPVPAPVARTLHRFTLDSTRQIRRMERATEPLNGQLIGTGAEELVARAASFKLVDALPQEIVLELTPRRSTKPIFSPLHRSPINRPDLALAHARAIFSQLTALDDVRLTIAGVGDPILHPELLEIIALARAAHIQAIHLETDFLDVDAATINALVDTRIDAISIHIPAVTPACYTQIMGVDALPRVLENIKTFVTRRQSLQRGTPLLVPVFTKCRQNLGEMETWYDQWIRALGSAVIAGPSDFGGQILDAAVSDISPPMRKSCARLSSRMTILSDGRIVSCEQDVLGKQVLGELGSSSIQDLWTNQFNSFRKDHDQSRWDKHVLCAGCREWHRP